MKSYKAQHLCDDDMQDIAIKIWTKKDTYDSSKAALSTWVFRIIRNHLIDKRKKERVEFPMSNFDLPEMSLEEGSDGNCVTNKLASEELSPIDNMIALEEREELLERIKQLPRAQRESALKYLEGDMSNRTRVNVTRAVEYLREGKKKQRNFE